MELPRRERGDELLKLGELTDLRKQLQRVSHKHDLTSVIACAFDHRTRMLPFIYADKQMVPAGVRAIGSAMADVGFNKTRIVLQQWNKHFQPAEMQLDSKIPEIFMVSSLQIHSYEGRKLIRNACQIPLSQRPLIIAGGPMAIYEPWNAFSHDPQDPWGADIVVTGEEFVLLSLLDTLLSIRGNNESLRQTLTRAKTRGILDPIPGLVYPLGKHDGLPEELVNTGVQRLVGDLDELPHPVLGYRLLEPPSQKSTLGSKALPANQVRQHSRIAALSMTFGCKFACPYCPIPAYNQRQYRAKSGERIADEMNRIYKEYGVHYFFGTDDNFFNDKERAIGILETLSKVKVNGRDMRHTFRWGTEVTVHDTLQMKDHLSLARNGGIRSLWIGVEDMTGTLVKKGQSEDKTTEAFNLLKQRGICPMPMMMHHDAQPLYTPGKPDGLLNQVRALRKAGAVSLQVLMIVPASGSKLYEETFTSELAYESVAGRTIETHMLGGNYVIASRHKQPWRLQFNIMITYLYFYNPLRFLIALVRPNSKLYLGDAGMQLLGMWGLAKTIQRTLGWALLLMRGNIKRKHKVPGSPIPMRSIENEPAVTVAS